MRKISRGATLYYALIMSLYWAIFCVMITFASAFLLDRGFTNSQIGLILGLSYLFSAFLQPVLGSVFSRHNIRLNVGIACVYAPVAVISLCIRLMPLGRGPLAVLIVLIFTAQSMLQPSINTLQQCFETPEVGVDFGLARGIGSEAYALASFVTGRVISRFAPKIIPSLYLGLILVLMAALLFARPKGRAVMAASKAEQVSYADMLRQHRRLGFYLIGAMCMFIAYSFIDAFLLQIILSLGGNSANLGTAIMLSAMIELPAMVLFSRLARKGRGIPLFRLSIWVWLAKDVLTFLARSPQMLYVVQMMSFWSTAIYVPGMMDYMRRTLPEDQLLRGATLSGTATTLGSLIATVMGGWLIDSIGMRGALGLVQVFAVAGTALMTIALTAAAQKKGGVKN